MADAIASFRHELLTPVNHIIGYCEILIEDAEGTGQEGVLAGLDSILRQGRQLLEDIERSLPGAADRVPGEVNLPALRSRLLAPLGQILEACDGMRWGPDAPALAGFVADLEKVRAAASSLIGLAGRIPGGDREARAAF
jgi:hypothetical protein